MNNACCADSNQSASPCSSDPSASAGTCSATCSLTYVPFYERCHSLLNVLGDVYGTDQRRDGNASAFVDFDATCLARHAMPSRAEQQKGSPSPGPCIVFPPHLKCTTLPSTQTTAQLY